MPDIQKKHILVVSQYFYPETFRINDMCAEWVRRGYRVSVVTGIPNYPMGRIFPGYGLFKRRRETWSGVNIYRIPLIPRGKGRAGMILNYLSFVLSGKWAGRFMKLDADIVFSYEVSPMTQVLAGVAFARRLKVPHLVYVQDLWPENVITVTGIKNKFVIGRIDKMVDRIYENADMIFTTSPSFAEAICGRKKPVERKKVHFWPQYAEEFYRLVPKSDAKKEAVKYGVPADDSFKVVFTGNIGTAQGLDILPRTALLLKNENVKFVIVGDGRYLEEFERDIQKRGLSEKFAMIPRQPADRISCLLCACDAAFVSFSNDPLWNKTIPAKLQSYMACGMPVIASASGETERVIGEAGCGMCCPTGNEEALAECIRQMKAENLDFFSKASLDYCKEHFDKAVLMDEMDEYL